MLQKFVAGTSSSIDKLQAQLINYLKASGLPVGLLVNFGNPKLEFKRVYHPGKFIGAEAVIGDLITF